MWVTTDSHRDFAEYAARDQQPHLALSSSSTLTREARSNSSGGQTVTVMQATKSWHGYDWATYIQAEDENASVSRQQGVVGERNSPRGGRGENEGT
jgi:hypothetical protein